MATLSGFIIANREWDVDTQLAMGGKSFGKTEYEAWTRHLPPHHVLSDDRSIYIQRWSDKGYGPVPVVLATA